MENLLGFIVFIIIVVVSIINKIRTESQAEKERQERPERPPSFEDVPEATRRMLYGDGAGIPVAKPRGAEQQRTAAPPSPHPVAARRVEYERPQPTPVTQTRPVPGSQPEAAPQPYMQPQPQPQRTAAPQQRTAAPPLRQPMQQTMREQPHQTMTRQQPPKPPRPVQQPARAVQHTPKKPAIRPAHKPRPQPAVAGSGASALGLASLFASKTELARGILLREILGPPKAFEDFG